MPSRRTVRPAEVVSVRGHPRQEVLGREPQMSRAVPSQSGHQSGTDADAHQLDRSRPATPSACGRRPRGRGRRRARALAAPVMQLCAALAALPRIEPGLRARTEPDEGLSGR